MKKEQNQKLGPDCKYSMTNFKKTGVAQRFDKSCRNRI